MAAPAPSTAPDPAIAPAPANALVPALARSIVLAPMIALVLSGALAAVASADTDKHTVADLEALVASGAYQEALTHAGDVAPTARSQKWADVTAAAAAGVVGALSTDDGAALFAIDAIDRQYPQLGKVAAYAKVRAERGVAALAGCWDQRGECSKLAARLVAADPRLRIDVARVAVRYDSALAVSLYRSALAPPLCRDADLRRAMVAGLDRAPDTNAAADARAIMTTCAWGDVKDAVIKAFDGAGKGSNVYKNTCSTLAAKGELSSLQAKRCK